MALSQQGAGITAQEISFQQNETDIEKRKILINNPNANTEKRIINYQSNENQLDREIRQFDIESQSYTNQNRLKNIESGIVRKKQNARQSQYNEPQYNEPQYNSSQNQENHGFTNIDISWNTWKSNFINRILDDSMNIKSLNDYNLGTWFYYSFDVTNTGEIQNVRVSSFTLRKEDKEAVSRMIQGYAHQDITIFPRKSRRKKAKVDAIMLLGDTESKSSPSDFNDTERVRIHY